MDTQELVKQAFQLGATDLLLTVGLPPMVRNDGALRPVDGWQRLMPDAVRAIAYEFLTQRQVDELSAHRQIVTTHHVQGAGRLRVMIYYQRGTLALAMRLIDAQAPSFNDLALPDAVRRLVMAPRGIVLVVGPAASGKSTTLAAMVQHLVEQRPIHILTIEDPIEFLIRHGRAVVEQRQLGDDLHNFAQGLRSVTLQAGDVAMLANVPDAATVEAAIELADAGGLVMAGMAVPNGPQAIERLLHAFPRDRQEAVAHALARSLVGVVAQQLVPRVNGMGQVLALEVLLVNDAVRAMIRERDAAGIAAAIEGGAKEGMLSFNTSLAALWRDSLIAREEAMARGTDAKALAKLIG